MAPLVSLDAINTPFLRIQNHNPCILYLPGYYHFPDRIRYSVKDNGRNNDLTVKVMISLMVTVTVPFGVSVLPHVPAVSGMIWIQL